MQRKGRRFLYETILGIFETALPLWDWHVFMWQSLKILKTFITMSFKQVFWKSGTFFEMLEHSLAFNCNEYKLIDKRKFSLPVLKDCVKILNNNIKVQKSRSTPLSDTFLVSDCSWTRNHNHSVCKRTLKPSFALFGKF